MERVFWKVALPVLIGLVGYGFIVPPLISHASDWGFYLGIVVVVLTTFGVVSTGWRAFKALRRLAK